MFALHPRVYFKGLVLIASFVGVAYLFEVSQLSSLLDKNWIDAEVRGQGIGGELLFVGMGAIATAVGLPRQAVSFLAGYAFDVALGSLLGLAATVGGCIIAFSYARWYGRGFVKARFPERVRHVDEFIHDNTLSMTLLIRLLPAGSNLVTNLAAGVANVRAAPFIVGSALGYIPQTLVFSLIGSGITLNPMFRIGLGVVLFLVSGMLGIYLFRKFRHGRHFDEELEHELGVDD